MIDSLALFPTATASVRFNVLGAPVDSTTYRDATTKILEWARAGKARVVCAAPVHSVLVGHDSNSFREALAEADLVTPDGAPVAWALRKLGCKDQRRVSGPDLMLHVLGAAAKEKIPVGLFGSTEQCIQRLKEGLPDRFPDLEIRYAYSPPFRSLSTAENEAVVRAIRDSGIRILFVGLGCPKQELWMLSHRKELSCVMIGVGAAFDMHAGLLKRAPMWMQRSGLEWLHRLASEPKRLFYRYLIYSPRFFVLFARQLARANKAAHHK